MNGLWDRNIREGSGPGITPPVFLSFYADTEKEGGLNRYQDYGPLRGFAV